MDQDEIDRLGRAIRQAATPPMASEPEPVFDLQRSMDIPSDHHAKKDRVLWNVIDWRGMHRGQVALTPDEASAITPLSAASEPEPVAWRSKDDPSDPAWTLTPFEPIGGGHIRERLYTAAALLAAERRERDAERRQSQAASDVLAERQRQVEAEGWTAEHDDAHGNGELARAAGCYATHAGDCYDWGSPDYEQADPPFTDDELGVVPWPWDIEWWKPTNPRRDLVKAAALILAEIERLDRAAAIRKGDAT